MTCLRPPHTSAISELQYDQIMVIGFVSETYLEVIQDLERNSNVLALAS
jgi:hypothetical protein